MDMLPLQKILMKMFILRNTINSNKSDRCAYKNKNSIIQNFQMIKTNRKHTAKENYSIDLTF